jgi:hypothetical protein
MRWEQIWRWMLAVLALILAARKYFVQELITLFLFFSVAFAMSLLLGVFSLVSLNLVDRGMNFLGPRLRALANRVRIMLSQPIQPLKMRGCRGKIQPEFIRYE